MNRFKFFSLAALLALCLPMLTACFINDEVQTSETGVVLSGGKFMRCVGPGVHTDLDFFSDLQEVSVSAVAQEVTDPEVATSDNQLVGITVYVQSRRKSDCTTIQDSLKNWSSIAISDDALRAAIDFSAREAIKVGTRQFDLSGLLSDRTGLASSIQASLSEDAAKFNVEIIQINVSNVDLNDAYTEELNKKALLTAQIDTAKRQQDLITQEAANDKLAEEQRKAVLDAKLATEQSQTAIEVEIANRAAQVAAANYAPYASNPYAYSLRRLELLGEVLGDNATVYFTPSVEQLILMLSGEGQPVPVPVDPGQPAQPR